MAVEITAELLMRLAPRIVDAQAHAAALEEARRKSSVDNPRRLAAILGQIYVETAGFTTLEENLRYRNPARLDAVFGAVKGERDAAGLIALGPEAIANRVYANRLGNGPEHSGDGWRYRGSGYIMLTGRSGYRAMGDVVGLDLEERPGMARQKPTAAQIAFSYWDARGCSRLADRGDLEAITAIVNGPAKLGLGDRREATIRALDIIEGLKEAA